MVPAFGFSVGDFVAAVQLIGKVVKALSNTSGATQQYEQAAIELRSLETILRRVQALQPSHHGSETVQQILMWSHMCHVPLATFVHRIARFESALSGGPTAHHFGKQITNGFAKIQWAVQIEKDVLGLKAKIAPQLTAIGLLLDLEAIERGDGIHRSVEESMSMTKTLFSEVDGLRTTLLKELADRRQMDVLADLMIGIADTSSKRHHDLAQLVARSQKSNIKLAQDMQEEFRQVKDLMVKNMKRTQCQEDSDPESKLQPPPTIEQSSSRGRRVQQRKPTMHNEQGSSIRRLKIMIAVIRAILAHTFLVCWAFIIAHLSQAILWAICTPSLLCATDMRFEDALGRVHQLQYEHFKRWPMLLRRLEATFVGLPGERQVREKQFKVEMIPPSPVEEPAQTVSWETWETVVMPGCWLRMSIIIARFPLRASCPRCHQLSASATDLQTCRWCGLIYRQVAGAKNRLPTDDLFPSGAGMPARFWRADHSITGTLSEISSAYMQHIVVKNAPTRSSLHKQRRPAVRHYSSSAKPSSAGMEVSPLRPERPSAIAPPQRPKTTGKVPASTQVSSDLACFKRVVVTDDELELKEVLQEHGSNLPWQLREMWAKQIITQLASLHESNCIHGDITLRKVAIDVANNARLFAAGAHDEPSRGWEAPELRKLSLSGHSQPNYVGVKTDLYQLGMVLWALAEANPQPELVQKPLPPIDDEVQVPAYFRSLSQICLHERPQGRTEVESLLDRFPNRVKNSSAGRYNARLSADGKMQ